MHLEHYLVEIIKGKRKGPLVSFIKFLLRILSLFYRLAVSVRNWAFDKGLLKRYHPPVPLVISIGNIVAGGSGKTPVTLLVAQEFVGEFQVAVLSRGYKSKVENHATPTILSQGKGPLFSAAYCGDEPYLIAEKIPQAIVIVGHNRHKSSNLAARAGANVILLDDGMQHRYLARDLDVVVMDAENPFGHGYFLPRGFLREHVKSIARAHMVILNHVQTPAQFDEVRTLIAKRTSAPIIGTRMEVEALVSFQGPLALSLAGKKVGVFCGIAQPDKFKQTLESLGAEIVASYLVSDHQPVNQEKLKSFALRAEKEGAEFLVCTEKDKVKLSSHFTCALPIIWLQMKLVIVAGQSDWNLFIKKAKADIIRRM